LRACARQGWSGTPEIGQIIRLFEATSAFDQGLAQQLANHLKAPCYALSKLKAENLYHAMKARPEWREPRHRRDEMAKPMSK